MSAAWIEDEREWKMMPKRRFVARGIILLPLLFLIAAFSTTAISCGSGSQTEQAASSTTKMPPGATGETLEDTSAGAEVTEAQATTQEEEEDDEDTDSTTTNSNTATSTDLVKTVYLAGANVAVVSASREDSNGAALTSSTREVSGDFLQVEMSITNVDDELVDLSRYSFRLWNAAIDADLYEDFYGTDGTYGGYVSENLISATLLDYETLQAVSLKLRTGETVDNLFLFYDLNPLSTAVNEGVSLAGTNLVIYDTNSGDQVEINLADYAE